MLTVLRHRDFSLLWFAGFISLIGDMMLVVALPVSVYELTGSAFAVGGLLIARQVPTLVLGSVAGVFVDRWDRKLTMVVANLARAPLLLLLLLVDSSEQLWIVYVVAVLVSTFSRFFRPAENALLPLLVGEEHLIPANSLNSLNNNLSMLIGPALGGLIAAKYGLGGVALIDALSFLVAGVLIFAIATPSKVDRGPLTDQAGLEHPLRNVWSEWLLGLHQIWGNHALRVVFGVVGIASLGEGVFSTAFWIYVDEALDGGAREAGLLFSSQAVGGLIGAFVIGSRARHVHPARLLGWGAIGLGVFDLMIFNYPAFISGIWLGMVLMAIVGVPASGFATGYQTVLQTETEDAYRGRIFGALDTTGAMLMILGASIAGAATARLGAVVILSIDGIMYIASGILALRQLAHVAVNRRSANASVPVDGSRAAEPPATA